MKIGIFSPYFDTLTGGEKYMFSIASCLSKKNDVTIFWDNSDIVRQGQERFDIDLSRVTVKPNIFSPNFSTAKRLLVTRAYDKIIFLSNGTIPLVASKELILHFQFPVEWVSANSFSTKVKLARVSKIICNSYFTKHYIDRKFGVDSFVLYPPSDIAEKKEYKKENVILTVGRFGPMKNGSDFKKLGEMVNAFKQFQKKRLKGWRLLIVTSVKPQDEGRFEEFSKKIKSSYIDVIKNGEYKDVRESYAKAKIYWHAAGFKEDLEKHPENAEHFGISTVEAMSFGDVPIVYDAGGQKEIVQSGKNGFSWTTTDELIEYTHKLATDKDIWKKMSNDAQDFVQKFGKNRFCDELNHII